MESAQQIQEELDRARMALLELSTRNRLLNIPVSGHARVVRIVEERSAEVYRILVNERKAFSFLPAADGWAEDGEDFAIERSVMEQPMDEEVGRHADLKLQTRLSSGKLQSRLRSLSVDAKTFIEDQGVNILYLTLGQLRWFEGDQLDTPRLAPLLLVSVSLERSSAAAKFRLLPLEEEASENLTLRARLLEFGIQLPELIIDEAFDPADYYERVAEAIAGRPGWEVFPDAMVLGFFSFAKFLMYRDLDGSNWPVGEGVEENPLIQALIRDGFRRPTTILDASQHLDELVSVERLNHVMDADSSQSLAIEEVRAGNNLIIQGPPGTGKSQTITNLIATAILDGKTVLFVAEKMAALQVVHRRLEEIGLGATAVELHSHKTNKKAFLEELGKTLKQAHPQCEEAERLLERLRIVREKLNQHSLRLNAELEPSGLSPFHVMGKLTSLSRSPVSEWMDPLEGAMDWSPQERAERESVIRTVAECLIEIGPVAQHPWRGVRCDYQSKFQLEEIRLGINSLRRLFADYVSDLDPLIQAMGTGADTVEAVSDLHLVGQSVLNVPEFDPGTICAQQWEDQLDAVKALVAALAAFQFNRSRAEALLLPTFLEVEWEHSRKAVAAHGQSWLRFLNKDYRAAMAQLRGMLREPSAFPKKFQARVELLDAATEARRQFQCIEKNATLGEEAFGSLWRGVDTDTAAATALLQWVDSFSDSALCRQARSVLATSPSKLQLAQLLQSSESALERFQGRWESLLEQLDLDTGLVFDAGSMKRAPHAVVAEKIQVWINVADRLHEWIQYWNIAAAAHQLGLEGIVEKLEAGRYTSDAAVVLFEQAYYRALYEGFIAKYPEMKSFSGYTHERLIDEFRELDNLRIQLARMEVLAYHSQQKPAMDAAYGALGIVLGEIAKKRRHMSIRKLVNCAGQAIQAIKPVFMMSPLSVAQFLEPGKIQFDLVIFDEASQVKPIEAMGAIARGRQLVVVGDNKQLPPSAFFSRIDLTDDPDEEEFAPAAAGDMESVLTLAAARGLQSRMLRWHYRSRHSSLIAVSNHEFYDSELFIVPSAIAAHPDLGLKFCYVADGIYNRGGRRQDNAIEAKAVATAVMEHAAKHADKSLGVAAFSVSQRDAILDELEVLRREHPELESFFGSAHPHEPFFVKNLENVQGDERDVIFISVGYGRDKNGSFAMNFGPINRDGGERRLNVLISRAKLCCKVFASIQSSDIDLKRSSARGVRALKTFLKYAERGVLGSAETDMEEVLNAPLERAVKATLEAQGHAVQERVGVAGFYVDLAVVHPDEPGRYVIGIEFDGTSYHASRSARERDRQRQMVLQDHGWTLHRIWSADWFMDPRKEMQKVLRIIEQARESQPVVSGPVLPKLKVEWVPPEQVSAQVQLTPPYREFTAPAPEGELADVSPYRLGDYVRNIVEVEGPIHIDELTARLRTLWGVRRLGNNLQELVDQGVATACRMGNVQITNEFFAIAEREVVPRNRKDTISRGLRSADRIAPEEITACIQLAVEAYHGVAREEVAQSVARLFGLGRTTESLDQSVHECIENMLRTGVLKNLDGCLHLARARSAPG
jgi:very-short-patch-repair endonuclease